MTVATLRSTKIFDLDGTLVECGIYYDGCLAQGAARLEEATGIPTAIALQMISHLDLAAVKIPGHAWGRDRFPNSFRAAAYAAAAMTNYAGDWGALALELWNIGNAVFDAPYALLGAVKETLERDRAAGWQLVLCTKGDEEVQRMKIAKHDFSAYFDRIYVVAAKTVEQLLHIVGDAGVDIASSWMIGDSKKDDIAPAQALGLNTALVERGIHSWSYNDQDIAPPTLVVADVADVPSGIGVYEFGLVTGTRAA